MQTEQEQIKEYDFFKKNVNQIIKQCEPNPNSWYMKLDRFFKDKVFHALKKEDIENTTAKDDFKTFLVMTMFTPMMIFGWYALGDMYADLFFKIFPYPHVHSNFHMIFSGIFGIGPLIVMFSICVQQLGYYVCDSLEALKSMWKKMDRK